jgi:SAM-dependent methyltransferase
MSARTNKLLHRFAATSSSLPFKARVLNQLAYRTQRLKGVPLPPTSVMKLVTGNEDATWYVYSSARAFQSVKDTLEKSHINIKDMHQTLDFGCGPGRVLRQWHGLTKYVQLHGVDYNLELVQWARRLVPFAHVEQNGLEPPLAYANNTFNFIYALSTFTHWSVELQKAWISEFTRILKPGGFLMFTTMGDYYLFTLTPEQRKAFAAGEPIVRYEDHQGANECGAFAPPAYVSNELRGDLTMLHYYPRSALGNPWQDVYLLQKP